MNNKQKLVYLSLIALTIIGILSGASYAYFSIENKIGNETVIESGTMALTFTDGSTITADKLIPGEYIEKTFSVRNTGTVRTNYDIYLSEVVNTFVNQSDLVYEIISSNGYNTSNQIQVPNTETKIINNYPIDPLQEHTYTLRITYKLTNEVQNDNMGRTFIAKINVNEYNQNNSETYIKLIDSSNNLLDKQVITNNTDYYYNLNNYDLTNSTNIYCNNGGIPTIENNQLKVSEVTTATDCKISNSINTTIDNLPDTKTGIVMTDNQNNVKRMNISSGKEVVLDLNGKEINSVGVNETSTAYNANHMVFGIYGTFVINDSVGIGGIFTGTTSRPIIAYLNSNIIINNGNYNGRQAIDVAGNNAYIEINGGNFYSKKYETIYMSDSNSNSKIIINNGNFYNSIDTVGVLCIENNTLNNSITINGGHFEGKGITIDNISTSGIINISDGNFESTNDNVIYNNGTTNITGGYFGKSSGIVINNQQGIINISNGDFITSNSYLINNIDTLNITGGSFLVKKESTIGSIVNNYGNAKLNISDEDNKVYMAVFNKENNWGSFGLYVTGGTVNINGGELADNCNENYESNSKGICIYVENSKGLNLSNNVSANINKLKLISIGSYAKQGILANKNTRVKINNSYLYANANAISRESAGDIDDNNMYICNSYISGSRDVSLTNGAGYIYYKNDVTFAHNNLYDPNDPSHIILDNNITCE